MATDTAVHHHRGIGVLAAVLYTWGLSSVGWTNSYYAAAVKAGTTSWKAFFFGAIDPGSFITVDKPPPPSGCSRCRPGSARSGSFPFALPFSRIGDSPDDGLPVHARRVIEACPVSALRLERIMRGDGKRSASAAGDRQAAPR